MLLYRPVGFKELLLIAEASFKNFPPRLPEQPIFYPVLNFEYAQQIAQEWNAPNESSGFAGFVTKFEVEDNYARHFEIHVVGGRKHEELWVPASELEEFNSHIIGSIAVVSSYYGKQCILSINQITNLPKDISP